MPIYKIDFGKIKEVHCVEFGKHDIMFFHVKEEGNPFYNMLGIAKIDPMLESESSQILDAMIGAPLDSHDVRIVLKFRSPEAITTLIQSLSRLQADLFKYQEWIENPDK